MPSAHDPSPPGRSGPRTVSVLSSAPATGPSLPYGLDRLAAHGWRPVPTTAHLRWTGDGSRPGRWVAATERRTTPWVQTLAATPARRRADAVLAMFESEGHLLAATRSLLPARRRGRRTPLVVVACWLTELAAADERRRRLYRRLYRGVDAVVVFSANQRPVLVDLLGLPPERIHVVPFGIEPPTAPQSADAGAGRPARVVAAGRDLGRDWATLAAAATGAAWPVDLISRPRQVQGLDLPDNVTVHGYLDHAAYLHHLAAAAVAVIPTDVRAYPTGQTVLLEAMALGRPVVVTDTPAMADYVRDGVDAVLVPPHDPLALRTAIDRLLAHPDRARRLGDAARERALGSFTADHLWSEVARILDAAVGVSGGGAARRRPD